MGIYLSEQVTVFIQALLVGAAFGLLYDTFRISRIAFPTAPGVIFVEDILFFIICAVVTFFFGLTVIDGMLRIFLLLGELLGAILYHFTLGRLVMGISKKIIEAIKAIIRFVFKWILHPIWMLIYHIITFILRPFNFLSLIFKKKLQNAKFRLKSRRRVLYNQLKGYINVKGDAKKRRERKDDKRQKDHT